MSSRPLRRARGAAPPPPSPPPTRYFHARSPLNSIFRYCNWLISEALEPVLTFLKVNHPPGSANTRTACRTRVRWRCSASLRCPTGNSHSSSDDRRAVTHDSRCRCAVSERMQQDGDEDHSRACLLLPVMASLFFNVDMLPGQLLLQEAFCYRRAACARLLVFRAVFSIHYSRAATQAKRVRKHLCPQLKCAPTPFHNHTAPLSFTGCSCNRGSM